MLPSLQLMLNKIQKLSTKNVAYMIEIAISVPTAIFLASMAASNMQSHIRD